MILSITTFCRNFFNTFKSIIKISVFHPFKNRYKYRKRNTKAAFILACGPSLANDIGDLFR